MNAERAVSAFLVLAAMAACSEANKQTYAQAAVGAGVAVAVVGVYRAVTHDCWAACRPGYLCNRESGLCELGECLPGCAYGSHCARDARGYRCVNDLDNQLTASLVSSWPTPGSTPAPPFDAGVVADASATDASAGAASPDASAAPP